MPRADQQGGESRSPGTESASTGAKCDSSRSTGGSPAKTPYDYRHTSSVYDEDDLRQMGLLSQQDIEALSAPAPKSPRTPVNSASKDQKKETVFVEETPIVGFTERLELLQEELNAGMSRELQSMTQTLLKVKDQQINKIINASRESERQYKHEVELLRKYLQESQSNLAKQIAKNEELTVFLREKQFAAMKEINLKRVFGKWAGQSELAMQRDRLDRNFVGPQRKKKVMSSSFTAWRSWARASRREKEQNRWQEDVKQRDEQLDKLRHLIFNLQEELQGAKLEIVRYREDQCQFRERMQFAFLRGVSALNDDAVGVIESTNADGGHYDPAAEAIRVSLGAMSNRIKQLPEQTKIVHAPRVAYTPEVTIANDHYQGQRDVFDVAMNTAQRVRQRAEKRSEHQEKILHRSSAGRVQSAKPARPTWQK